ncbi:MAG: N-acetylmuramoyl-L-alanine amidase [Bacteroidales bacterium]|nr:N-acetylmuramoyl-L-alanine amidase [Bacteroidales bacterium]
MHNRHCHNLAILLSLALILSAFPSFSQNKGHKELGLTTVVIDPGHGGKDAGCISRDKKTYEKNLVLDIGKRLRDKLNAQMPGLKVIMTRSDDRFIDLGERAAIANRNDADLFISLHIDALDTKKNTRWRTINGFSIYALGQSRDKNRDLFANNMELCKRENSVILMEDDYTTKYQGFDPNDTESYIMFNLMQNSNLGQSLKFAETVDAKMKKGPVKNSRGVHQGPLMVLWRTTMPAVLVECGYITHDSDLAALRRPAARDSIASCLAEAIKAFKKEYDKSLGLGSEPAPVPAAGTAKEPEKPAAEVDETTETTVDKTVASAETEGVWYGTQVLVSSRKISPSDKFFQGLDVRAVPAGNLYKYIVGCSGDLEESKKKNTEVRKKFSDSFLVKVEQNAVSRVL